MMKKNIVIVIMGDGGYQLGNTSSRTITAVKQRRAWLVLGYLINSHHLCFVTMDQ